MNVDVVEVFNRFAEQYADFTFNNILQYELNKFISMLPKGGVVLDLGCGSGRDVQYFLDYKLNVTGIDASENLISEAKKRVTGKFEVMDMKSLSFDDETFDGTWAQDSISYVSREDVKKIFDKLFKVLKNNGVFFISVREGDGEVLVSHEKLGRKDIKITFFSKGELEKLLKSSGFEILNSYVQDGEDFKWVNVFVKKA